MRHKSQKVSFGTDGWRGVIADDFTFANLVKVSEATANYFIASCPRETPKIVVGYDTRFLSKQFARKVAQVLASKSIKVMFTESFAPTPVLSYSVVKNDADGGIVITASHNPPKFNGFKVKANYGGSATPEIMADIEKHYHKIANKAAVKPIDFSKAVAERKIEPFNPWSSYKTHLKSLLKQDLFSGNNLKICVDPLYGAGQGYLKDILTDLGCQVYQIHDQVLPSFAGLNPEPIEANLTELKKQVVKGGYNLGLALDGDADRIGAVDELGNFVDSHKIFSLLLQHLVEHRNLKGKVVKTVSTTQMVDKLARQYNLELCETPIGFKYICQEILSSDVLIGGEESGGISIKGHVPERDGILIGCLIAEILLYQKKPLSQLISELMKSVGFCYYQRLDKEITSSQRDELIGWLKANSLPAIGKRQVVKRETKDGFKFFFKSGGWLILRPSGTEPVVRIYAETASIKDTCELIKDGQELLQLICSTKAAQ
jgi:alpha-D-glucose phosphate-specific phosphoglucomutase